MVSEGGRASTGEGNNFVRSQFHVTPEDGLKAEIYIVFLLLYFCDTHIGVPLIRMRPLFRIVREKINGGQVP